MNHLTTLIGNILGNLNTCCCLPCFTPDKNVPYITVPEGRSGVMCQYGKYISTLNPGLHYLNPITEKCYIVDMREVCNIYKTIVITKDNLSLTIDFSINFKCVDPVKLKFNVNNGEGALKVLVESTVRTIIGCNALQEILEHRSDIACNILKDISHHVDEWGIQIIDLRLIDVIIPESISQMLSSEATAKAKAKALIITAEANVLSAKKMREASDLLDTPSGMQMRYLQTLEQISSGKTKIIFIPLKEGAEKYYPLIGDKDHSPVIELKK